MMVSTTHLARNCCLVVAVRRGRARKLQWLFFTLTAARVALMMVAQVASEICAAQATMRCLRQG